jgi:hypothetical protein
VARVPTVKARTRHATRRVAAVSATHHRVSDAAVASCSGGGVSQGVALRSVRAVRQVSAGTARRNGPRAGAPRPGLLTNAQQRRCHGGMERVRRVSWCVGQPRTDDAMRGVRVGGTCHAREREQSCSSAVCACLRVTRRERRGHRQKRQQQKNRARQPEGRWPKRKC